MPLELMLSNSLSSSNNYRYSALNAVNKEKSFIALTPAGQGGCEQRCQMREGFQSQILFSEILKKKLDTTIA